VTQEQEREMNMLESGKTKKVRIERMKQEAARRNIEECLLELGVDLNNIPRNVEWLPLEMFDDGRFEDHAPADWLRLFTDEEGQAIEFSAKALVQEENALIAWERCHVVDYNEASRRWRVRFEDGEEMEVIRLHLLLEVEDVGKFAERMSRAYVDRIYMDSKIRYEFYVNNMPKNDSVVARSSANNIVTNSKNSRKLRENQNLPIESEVEDINQLYSRTMNKILFNKYLEEGGNKSSILPNKLVLPEMNDEVIEPPEYGLIELDRASYTYEPKGEDYSYPSSKDFNEIFQDFCLDSILTKKCANSSLQEIKYLCLDVRKREVFKTKFSKELKYDEFKQAQETATSQLLYSLKIQWIGDIQKIIETKFQDEKEGWFDMSKANPSNYYHGKLKSFMNLVKLQMQDTMTDLIHTNFNKFVETIESYIPKSTTINSVIDVVNEYSNGELVDSKIDQKFKQKILPLFAVELKIVEKKVQYSVNPKFFQGTVLRAFKDTLRELNRIPDIESKITGLNFKRRNDTYLNVPKLDEVMPAVPDPNERPKKYQSPNIWVWNLYTHLENITGQAIQPLLDFHKKTEVYEEIMQLSSEEFEAKYNGKENGKPIDFILGLIKNYREEKESIDKKLLPVIQVSCFSVDCTDVIRNLKNIYEEAIKALINIIAKRYSAKGFDIDSRFKEIRNKIETDPPDVESLTDINNFIKLEMPGQMAKLKEETAEVIRIYDLLEDMNHKVDEVDTEIKWNIYFKYPQEILFLVDEREEALNQKKRNLYEEMRADQSEFKQKIDALEVRISSYYQKANMSAHDSMFDEVNKIDAELKEVTEKSRKFNSREGLFEKEVSDYSKIGQNIKEFDPYLNLWRIVHNWFTGIVDWKEGPFASVNAIEAQTFVEDGSRILGQVSRFFKDKDPIQYAAQITISESIKRQIDDFKPHVPLLVALRMEGMGERHWREITQKSGKEIDPTMPGFNFQWVLDHGFMSDLLTCQDVGERASKEFRIQKNLEEMKNQWETVEFKVEQHKNTSSSVVKGFDMVETILDEHLSTSGAMMINPYNKYFINDISDWFTKMQTISFVVEEWRKFQAQWAYLQPIFEFGDISRYLALEADMFKVADKFAKSKVASAKQIKKVLLVCTEENFLQQMKEQNANLEKIQHELNHYLETKRSKFARFYFLSNDDLLSILSQTKEVERIQAHLYKVFENMSKLQFDEEKQITAMYSVEGEKVVFTDILDPVGKQVEDWMTEVENQMKKSVRDAMLKAINTYTSESRTRWVFENPGQCSLNGSQVHWTKEVEDAIKGNTLKQYVQKLQNQLLDMVKIDRNNFTTQKNITLEALVVVDVHAKEVTELLENQRITDTGAFEWIQQLRYYWLNDNCQVRCIQTFFPYGYEYLGNTPRLVITPLTDKCYMTLMGAIKLNLGGAPAGPAGTGKTETTKDLAKALAKQCVVFNCQESMTYKFVGTYFKGLACTGAWCCFDEFNLINVEVLSVVAQQLQELFTAKAAGIVDLKFEDTQIKILPTFSVFITMNPGYAGRTELPDNLKALFRPMAMMVPDYALIAQIKLFSYGFTQAPILAKKMVTTFKLASEQLSSQKHYDFGMRSVTSVINAAGLLKRASTEPDEFKLLLRALKDVNVPKFLKDDIFLFDNIIEDLFPGTEKPTYEYGKLIEAIHLTCDEMHLQKLDPFLTKILQLYDTIQVRHGLMIVGPTGGGKTSNYKVLQKSISRLKSENPAKYKKVHVDIIFPKSIEKAQLYGVTKDMNWDSGVIEMVMEAAIANKENDEFNWIMFDGPVEAAWIEYMNTVLDDNKKLCLANSKILPLTPLMTMMFEVEDLIVASPATVSRCGMVYMEPTSMGLKHFIESYIKVLPEVVHSHKGFITSFRRLVDSYLYPALKMVRAFCKECVTTADNNLINSFIKLFDVMVMQNRKIKTLEQVEEALQLLDEYVIFVLIWSICCTVDHDGRLKLDLQLRKLMAECKCPFTFEEGHQMYDFKFYPEEKKWRLWTDEYKDYKINPNKAYAELVVPTLDFGRSLYLMKTLLSKQHHVLLPGPTGTGKSMNAFSLLTSVAEDFNTLTISLSAQTKAGQILDSIFDGQQMDRRNKGVYGPPFQRKLIVFIDDFNMPKKEDTGSGAQPPLELIRQYMDYKHWYVFKPNKDYFEVRDMIILGAMGPPGGGRNFVSDRVIRHFNVIAYTELSDGTMKNIFTTILNGLLYKFEQTVQDSIDKLTEATIRVYNESKKVLLPKPGKSHYLFNLRDISRVFQGICRGSNKQIKEEEDLVRIWYHENCRVYHDRLTTTEDRTLFTDLLKKEIRTVGVEVSEVMNAEKIIFGDFMIGRDGDNSPYIQIPDMPKFISRIEEYLVEYNRDMGAKRAMHLVMFLDACEHISRICRVLRQSNGHCLLMGVGGSGRQSLAKLSSYMIDLKNFGIEVSKEYGIKEWREDMKRLIMGAVIENRPTCFIFVDIQILRESFVEDINCLLNSGAITGLPLNVEEQKAIDDIGKSDCLRNNISPNKINIYNAVLNRVKKNTHIVMAMSPLSLEFATRLRMFPALINCCTLDWFTEWPNEALIGVAKGFLSPYKEKFAIEKSFEKIIEMFKIMHKSVETISVRFLQEVKRHNYVTPTSFLELLNLYKVILNNKSTENENLKKRFEDGLLKLQSAEADVSVLEAKLIEDKPILEQKEKETKLLLEDLKKDKAKEDETRKVVALEEVEAIKKQAEANGMAQEAQALKDICDKELQTILDQTKDLKKNEVVFLKSLQNPPIGGKIIVQALCYMLLEEKEYPGLFRKDIDACWQLGKSSALDVAFLFDAVVSGKYDNKNLDPRRIKAVEDNCKGKDWNLERMKNTSDAVRLFYLWVNAQIEYNRQYMGAKDLRDRLEALYKDLDEKNELLRQKKAMLEESTNRLRLLEEKFIEKENEKEELVRKMNECKLKLERAGKLVTLLADEKKRWREEIINIKESEKLIPHDCLIAAGMVSYAGPFVSEFRMELEKSWVNKLKEMGLEFTPDIRMSKFLGDPVKILNWNLNGLPKDDTSIENGIIIDKSERFPLMIDPQNQGNKYIRNLGVQKNERFEPIKASSSTLMKQLEQKIQNGEWALIENVSVSLDPAFEPILKKQVISSGGNKTITLGTKAIPYDDDFRFFMTTTIPNPHYSPEVFAKVTIINFGITPSGLEEQMLAQIILVEMPSLEETKARIVKDNAANKKKLKDCEDKILKNLSESTGDILMDETLIKELSESKLTSTEINVKMKESMLTEIEIDKTRENYRPAAFRASVLFFCINDLCLIDPMYQYSLQWFEGLFKMGIKNSPTHPEIDQRLKNLNDYFTYSLYENVCRSLFEKHKLIFSFVLNINIMMGYNQLDLLEWRFLLTGPTGEIKLAKNPTSWIAENSWPEIYRYLFGLDKLPAFKGILEEFMNNPDMWKEYYQSQNPQEELFPGKWESLNPFQKVVLIRTMRSDKMISMIQKFVTVSLGKKFIEFPTPQLSMVYKDSNCTTPLIFVLSTGSDPKSGFDVFSKEMDIKNINSISLGQGQGEKAEKMIKECSKMNGPGGWVLLQNCHLAISWMPRLEALCEEFNIETTHPEFRLWLTAMPSDKFPVSVLQNSVKMTLEPPTGLKSNLKLSYTQLDDKILNSCKKQTEFKKLVFGLCFFHAIVQERRKFGPIGWNIAYEFTYEDLLVSRRQLQLFLDDYEEVPFKVINFITAEINYGGRVTDDKDKRLISTILRGYINPNMLIDGFKLSESGVYVSPEPGVQADYLNYIESLPLTPNPEVFGLHENAEIINNQNAALNLLFVVQSIQTRSSNTGGKTKDQIIEETSAFIDSKIPELFDMAAVLRDFPTKYEESMNTVITQEVEKYNNLLKLIKGGLKNIEKALKGFISMDEDLEKLADALYNQRVPIAWGGIFLSLKPLMSWIEDLNNRIQFVTKWIRDGTPNLYWISGFCFPQAFITGTLQNYARKMKIAIDRVSFNFKYMDHTKPEEITAKPEDGVYIFGVYLEGAKWDHGRHIITDPQDKELYSEMPMIWLIPSIDRVEPTEGVYQCPVYKVVSRAGTLSTTGHSTNFVMYFETPSSEDQSRWIKAGVAAFLALRI
jgi:dynein heavy chain